MKKMELDFRDLAEALPDAMIVADRRGRIVMVNAQVERLLGYSEEELLGKPVEMLMPERLRHRHRELCKDCGRVPQTRMLGSGLDFSALSKDGREVPVDIALRPFPLAAHLGVAYCIRDISRWKQAEGDLRMAQAEIARLKRRLERENAGFHEKIRVEHPNGRLVGCSDAMQHVLNQVEQVAATAATVLLLGETGTGKELLAHLIHDLSMRRSRSMIHVNCAALPATLMESELFGREAGAYTGAESTQKGRFEIAHGSTLFLDEIGEVPKELQSKLLRVLQERQFERLGSPRTIAVDVRVVAATNRDLDKAVEDGTFRADLYHRLNVFPIIVPPLRQRLDDIEPLVWSFVREFETPLGKRIDTVSPETMESLRDYWWPGNVRELRNVIERAMILACDSTLHIDLPSLSNGGSPKGVPSLRLEEMERRHILDVLERTGGRIRGQNGAAELLGLKPTTLESRMQKLQIDRRPSRSA